MTEFIYNSGGENDKQRMRRQVALLRLKYWWRIRSMDEDRSGQKAKLIKILTGVLPDFPVSWSYFKQFINQG